MAMKLNLALLSMAVASGGAWYGCMTGTEVVTHVDAGSGGTEAHGSGGASAGSGGNPGTGGIVEGTGGAGSGGESGMDAGGDLEGSGGRAGPGTGGSDPGSGGVTDTGTGGRAPSGGATASGGDPGSGGVAATGGVSGSGGAGGGAGDSPINVLVWNNALAYGHASRVGAIPYLKAREATDDIRFDTTYAHTEPVQEGTSDMLFDASVFTDAGLEKYDVVMFLDTTGNTIDDSQKSTRRQALQDFIEKKGRGFVGTHSATDTYQGSAWPWYVDFIGANFDAAKGHSAAGTSGTAQYYQMKTHPILMAAATPNPWNRSEEWYTLTRDPASSKIPGITILLTCHDVQMTQERPTAWVHEMPVAAGGSRAGRLFYTAFGHATSAFQEKPVMDLLIAAIKWTAHRL